MLLFPLPKRILMLCTPRMTSPNPNIPDYCLHFTASTTMKFESTFLSLCNCGMASRTDVRIYEALPRCRLTGRSLMMN